MARYIKREALPKKKERGLFSEDAFNAGWNACLNNIEYISDANVRPVILCQDCVHSKPWYADKSLCFLWNEDGNGVFNDGFCSYGEIHKTNADHIRSMTDEELAKFLEDITICEYCFNVKKYQTERYERYPCEQPWIDWLKQEVKDGYN